MDAPVFSTLNVDGGGPAVIVCEHASNAFPAEWGDLGTTAKTRKSHAAWDPGALDLARALSARLDAPLIHGTVSRLIYDLNRPPHAPSAMPKVSEQHEIPGNRDLTPAERLRRTEAIYLPFHAALAAIIARRLARGVPTALVTVHSFNPVYFNFYRNIEFGVVHDAEPTLARRVAAAEIGLTTRLNEPYSAADGVAHTLALHATPLKLPHVMLELRADLLAKDGPGIAARLAPVLADAMGTA